MKIVVLDGYALNPGDLSWDLLSKLGDLELHERTAPEDVHKRIQDATAIVTNKVTLTKELLEGASKLNTSEFRLRGTMWWTSMQQITQGLL
ncbi:Rossmann-fold NAD(P)-binding domain-containing protein [Mangrovibacterium lignilyticum]|uniref:hypothetical protein n=1 Tax=Mangrovibacterium lignilyticum TaxID=2668052 RepID=UPI001967E700|nr:hypothetical protein [Mangrovibacterium lignilyticum]